ncbi:hypothetical protein vBDshSR4C_041 [Dinoroseobacter phage vB_DshS-R4C]|nr:hypothetical protein vBDshSR4C_041 [Dinoroseobacter phage vB_DshS-R4C]
MKLFFSLALGYACACVTPGFALDLRATDWLDAAGWAVWASAAAWLYAAVSALGRELEARRRARASITYPRHTRRNVTPLRGVDQ